MEKQEIERAIEYCKEWINYYIDNITESVPAILARKNLELKEAREYERIADEATKSEIAMAKKLDEKQQEIIALKQRIAELGR